MEETEVKTQNSSFKVLKMPLKYTPREHSAMERWRFISQEDKQIQLSREWETASQRTRECVVKSQVWPADKERCYYGSTLWKV